MFLFRVALALLRHDAAVLVACELEECVTRLRKVPGPLVYPPLPRLCTMRILCVSSACAVHLPTQCVEMNMAPARLAFAQYVHPASACPCEFTRLCVSAQP